MIINALNPYHDLLETLLPGEEICPDCGGKGGSTLVNSYTNAFFKYCSLCEGRGKIDWIQKAMGVQS